MAIRFRCATCGRLLSITSRRIGDLVPCPDCGTETRVPERDVLDPEQPAFEEPPAENTPDLEFDLIEFAAVPEPIEHPLSEEEEDEEPELRLRRLAAESDEMDLTPMVDMTFLLLIFFMITASFELQKAIRVPVPDSEQQGALQSIQQLEDLEATSIIVRVDERDRILVDEEPLEDAERLADLFRDKMRLEQKTELVINADANARHRTVIQVIDAANAAGLQRIRLATRAGPAAL